MNYYTVLCGTQGARVAHYYLTHTNLNIMGKLFDNTMDAEVLTNTDSWWKPIDKMRMEIDKYNRAKGLKTIMGGAWTYDKLVQNARKRGYTDVECMGVEQLIEIADVN